MHATAIATILAICVGLFAFTRRKTTSTLPLPPGPPALPLIGNVHQAPKSHGWRQYYEWSKTYGPVVYLNMLGQSVVILSSTEAAQDLLAKKGAYFSDRPRLFLAFDLAMKGWNILMMSYTEQFRRHQKLQVSVLGPTPVAAYLPFQTLESEQLLHDLLENAGGTGTDVHGYFQRAVASVIHTLLYGFRVQDENEPVLRDVITLNEEFSDFVQVGKHIVDTFPILNNLPGFLAPWKAKADSHYNRKYSLRMKNFQRGLAMEEWNICKQLKAAVEKEGMEMPMDELAFELGTMIDAALDGTTDSLLWFVVACITQDEKRGFMAKAREELDTVIGRDRLPGIDDRPDLPYITAITEEIYRWRPVGPEGVPHFTNTESTYEGYTIPAKSVIIPNVWAITREESAFGGDPEDFIPERWLETGGKTLKTFPLSGFGYGRRVCPGRHFARNMIWIIVAQLLWSFDIKAGVDETTGEPIPVDDLACTYGLVMRALPFKAVFEPRGAWVREMIGKTGETYGTDIAAMLQQVGGS